MVGIPAYFSTPGGLRRRRNGDAPHIDRRKAGKTGAGPPGAGRVGAPALRKAATDSGAPRCGR
ncbi:hypothetical protein Ani05nite_58820 [Amorphoplanes nipponensis]|uniref:Uncharacterized protein n=1 Tax=Actinoplanes nipponensis TaxID=135950 RepID=A0A919JKA2_9ACTN|nr:hypothetical protein Ani05nite_58820 [Actinoplanes nipponensis]